MKSNARHRHICWLVAPVLATLGAPAFAGGLYRCSGAKGELAYTNKPAGYANCVQVASYQETKAKPVTADTAPDISKPTFSVESAKAAPQPGQWQYNDSQPGAAEAAAAGTPAPAPAVARSESPKVLRGAVYKINKRNGITEYTNIRPAGKSYQVLFTYMATCFACDVRSTVNFSLTKLNREAYRAEIAAAALEFGVDEALLRAVVHAESAFNPNALSKKGAQGLMQLMPGTADDLGVENAFDATQNIRGGAQYLAQQLKSFQGDERLAMAAYNAGPANVSKYGGVPPFDETQVYVSRVSTLRDRYRQSN
ncbi:soluble lytic murein transglycosylase-like protein [Tahibacter aquaticus]|uniref:Soluble lytic murein transglycosylase-like protein n=1 Tax=Tahibacter aquaticus TaxID=520092 RepID=A0A4R6YWT6_9GAMM|nr:lytic transglycosylase domain-containing protein [Tahibacter aquaticus]TDR43157.1 soluble lytic murein transglycosylase-like protein [Tahibacter aquaticus]